MSFKFALRFIFGREGDSEAEENEKMTRKLVKDVMNRLLLFSVSNPENPLIITSSKSSLGSITISFKQSPTPRDLTDGHHYRHLSLSRMQSSLNPCPCQFLPDVISSSQEESFINIGRNLKNIALSFHSNVEGI
jgi:hypothetical protein